MKTKKQSTIHDTMGATKFVASAPIEKINELLHRVPDIRVHTIRDFYNRIDYRIHWGDTHPTISIFVSMTKWNRDETLISLSYYYPSRFRYGGPILLLLTFAFVFGLIGLSLTRPDAILACFCITLPILLILFIIASFSNTPSPTEYDGYEIRRIQEDLKNLVVDELKYHVDLEIV